MYVSHEDVQNKGDLNSLTTISFESKTKLNRVVLKLILDSLICALFYSLQLVTFLKAPQCMLDGYIISKKSLDLLGQTQDGIKFLLVLQGL